MLDPLVFADSAGNNYFAVKKKYLFAKSLPQSNRGAVRSSRSFFTLKASERGDSLSRRRKRRSGTGGGADNTENSVVEVDYC